MEKCVVLGLAPEYCEEKQQKNQNLNKISEFFYFK